MYNETSLLCTSWSVWWSEGTAPPVLHLGTALYEGSSSHLGRCVPWTESLPFFLGGWVGPRVGLVFLERKYKRTWLSCWESNLASWAAHSPQSTPDCRQHADCTFWLSYRTKTAIIMQIVAHVSRCVAGERLGLLFRSGCVVQGKSAIVICNCRFFFG